MIDTAFIPYLNTGIFGSYLECDVDKSKETFKFFTNYI